MKVSNGIRNLLQSCCSIYFSISYYKHFHFCLLSPLYKWIWSWVKEVYTINSEMAFIKDKRHMNQLSTCPLKTEEKKALLHWIRYVFWRIKVGSCGIYVSKCLTDTNLETCQQKGRKWMICINFTGVCKPRQTWIHSIINYSNWANPPAGNFGSLF